MVVDIVLLSWNFTAMTVDCLKALKAKTLTVPYRLIWVDNGSMQENFEQIKSYVESLTSGKTACIGYEIFRFEENQFYAKGTNKGIELSDSRYVVALSNDVLVTKNWLKKLVEIMDKNPTIGLLSPLTDNIGSNCPRASLAIREHNLLRPDEPYENINKLPSRFAYCDSNVSMFCAILRRQMIDKIGMLDERFTCYGNDDDYNDRVRHAEWKAAVALNCFVYHVHKITKDQIYSPEERNRVRREHRVLLREKRAEREREKCMSTL